MTSNQLTLLRFAFMRLYNLSIDKMDKVVEFNIRTNLHYTTLDLFVLIMQLFNFSIQLNKS